LLTRLENMWIPINQGKQGGFKSLTSCLAIVLLLSCSCNNQERKEKQAAYQERIYTNESFSVRMSLDKPKYTVADQPKILIEITSLHSVEPPLLPFTNQLGAFRIMNRETLKSYNPALNEHIQKHLLILEPFLPGEYLIPPLHFTSRSRTHHEQTNILTTEEIVIPVISLFSDNAANQTLRNIPPPIELVPHKGWMFWLAIGIVAILTAAWALLRKRKLICGLNTLINPDPLDALEQLLKEGLIQKGEIKLFYYKLSSLLRNYLEFRFGLHAPEQTTREFINGLTGARSLSPTQKRLLQEFLKYCDLVKFAEHQPRFEDIESTIACYRYFIFETAKHSCVSANSGISNGPGAHS